MIAARIHELASVIIGCLFLAILALPLINTDNRLNLDSTVHLDEKRKLADEPRFDGSLTSLARFPRAFEDFYNDHFGFRNTLVRINSLTQIVVFRESPSADVVIGNSGWLYYAGNGSTNDHRGLLPLSDEQLRLGKQHLENRRDQITSMGAKYVFVVVPNKQTIYPEYLPLTASTIEGPTRMDQFLEYMLQHSDFQPIDLRPNLIGAKSPRPLYFKTDSHWNPYGAYNGYSTVAARLSTLFSTVRATPPTQITIAHAGDCCHDLATLAGADGFFPPEPFNVLQSTSSRAKQTPLTIEGMADAVLTETEDPSLPSAVVVCDSFCDAYLRELLAENFRQAVFVRPKTVDYDPTALVMRYHPDLVITEVIERHLVYAIGALSA